MQKVDAAHIEKVAHDGFAILEDFLDQPTVSALIRKLSTARVNSYGSQRAGLVFGLRDLLNVVPATRELANSALLKSMVVPIIGDGARVVRAIYFDKHKDANWKVAWHQDLTIAVRKRVEVEGFGPWSIKAGITHVQPAVAIVENMLAIRIHLDETDETNGALLVIPGSHRFGRVEAQQIQRLKEQNGVVTCGVKSGGAMLMKPLLLHSSQPSVQPEHRRVLHFEYAATELPAGLEWFEADRSL